MKKISGIIDRYVKRLDLHKISYSEDSVKRFIHYIYFLDTDTYTKPFMKDDGSVTADVHIDEIFALIDYDRNIRSMLFYYLSQIETTLKTVMANQLKYPCIIPLKKLTDFERSFYSLNDDYLEREYMSIHGHSHKIEMDFGCDQIYHQMTYTYLGRLYHILSKKIKNQIVDIFMEMLYAEYNIEYKLTDSFIDSFLKMSGLYRNACAHSNKLYNTVFKQSLSTKNIAFVTEAQGLDALIHAMFGFLQKGQYDTMCDLIKKFREELEENIHSIPMTKIFKNY